MFNNEAFEILLKELKNSPREDFPVASFVKVGNKNFQPFTNKVYKLQNHLNHSEILSITHTLKSLNIMDFKGFEAILYTTLEPCCMCLAFASLVRVSKIVYYAEDIKFGGVARIFTLNSAFTKPEILFIEKEEIKTIMNNFFKTKR